MRRLLPVLPVLLVLITTGCSGVSFRPTGVERRPLDPREIAMYEAVFEVACERCRVEYGKEDALLRDMVEGGWSGRAPLGAIRDGDQVRIILRVTPLEGARILGAEIRVDGRTVASSEGEDPGESVTLRARVG